MEWHETALNGLVQHGKNIKACGSWEQNGKAYDSMGGLMRAYDDIEVHGILRKSIGWHLTSFVRIKWHITASDGLSLHGTAWDCMGWYVQARNHIGWYEMA